MKINYKRNMKSYTKKKRDKKKYIHDENKKKNSALPNLIPLVVSIKEDFFLKNDTGG